LIKNSEPFFVKIEFFKIGMFFEEAIKFALIKIFEIFTVAEQEPPLFEFKSVAVDLLAKLHECGIQKSESMELVCDNLGIWEQLMNNAAITAGKIDDDDLYVFSASVVFNE
jgi:hypothetical protein